MINKPFMFLVRDKNSGDIWFIGNMYQPNKWADDQALYQ
jgi:serpin B